MQRSDSATLIPVFLLILPWNRRDEKEYSFGRTDFAVDPDSHPLATFENSDFT
jgi:hypothetical protein